MTMDLGAENNIGDFELATPEQFEMRPEAQQNIIENSANDTDDTTAEAQPDPIAADLLSFKGGAESDWKLDRSGEGYTFDGNEVVNIKTGEAWGGFTKDTLEALRTSDFVRLDAIEVDGKESVTYLIKGPDNSISYAIYETDLAKIEADEIGLETFTPTSVETSRFAWQETFDEVAPTVDQNNEDAAMMAAEITMHASEEIIVEDGVESADTIEPAADTQTRTAVAETRRDEAHAEALREILPIDQLPIADLDAQARIILHAPETKMEKSPIQLADLLEIMHAPVEAAQPIAEKPPVIFMEPRVPAPAPERHEVAPHVAPERRTDTPAQRTEQRSEPSVVQQRAIERLPAVSEETITESGQHISIKAPERHGEMVAEIPAPRVEFREHIDAPRPIVETTVEQMRAAPLSIAERAVMQTLERITPTIAPEIIVAESPVAEPVASPVETSFSILQITESSDKEITVTDDATEPVVAVREVPEAAQIEEQLDSEPATSAPEVFAREEVITAPVAVAEREAYPVTERIAAVAIETAPSEPTHAVAPERMPRSETETTLEPVRALRGVSNPEAIRAANENLQFVLSGRAQPAAHSDDFSTDVVAMSSGITMRMKRAA